LWDNTRERALSVDMHRHVAALLHGHFGIGGMHKGGDHKYHTAKQHHSKRDDKQLQRE